MRNVYVLPNSGQNFLPIILDFLWMQTQHREAEARKFLAEGYDSLAGFQINPRHTNSLYPSFTSSGNHLLQIVCEFFSV